MAFKDFIEQLTALGYNVEDRGENRITIRYTIPLGRFIDQEVLLGFVVAEDFPLTPPSGPHISPELLPRNTSSNQHPDGGIHESPFGAGWQYWSRPFPEWHATDRTVKTYMAHIRRLFDQ